MEDHCRVLGPFEQERWIDSKLPAALAKTGCGDLAKSQSLVFRQIEAIFANESEYRSEASYQTCY